MKLPNLSEWALRHQQFVGFLIAVIGLFVASFLFGGNLDTLVALAELNLKLSSGIYGSTFFMLTGFHGLHVTGGLIAFLFIMGRAFVAKRFGHYEATSAIVVVSLILTIAAGPLWDLSERAAENLQNPINYVNEVLGGEG